MPLSCLEFTNLLGVTSFCLAVTVQFGLSTQVSAESLVGFSRTQDHVYINIAQGARIENIYLYGFGSMWPFEAEGEENEHDDGSSISNEINRAVSNGQQIMVTCALAPSDYRLSHNPWQIEEAVDEQHESQFAERCADAVSRWPEIQRVQVWNELKGYWNSTKRDWDVKSYTRFYNTVYKKIKERHKNVQVCGPYVSLSEGVSYLTERLNGVLVDAKQLHALQYWIKHAAGFDAICFDSLAPNATEFLKIIEGVRALAPSTPIWLSEFYIADPTKLNSPVKFDIASRDMREVREALRIRLRDRDVVLWWAERRFVW